MITSITTGIDGPMFLKTVAIKTVNETMVKQENKARTTNLQRYAGVISIPNDDVPAIAIPFGSKPPKIEPNAVHKPTQTSNNEKAKTKPDKNNDAQILALEWPAIILFLIDPWLNYKQMNEIKLIGIAIPKFWAGEKDEISIP